jgi:serine/threonine protein kinase
VVRFHGTPFFAAPEIFAKGLKADGIKADVLSLGVTLFSLVAGIPPLNRVHDARVVLRILKGKTPGLAHRGRTRRRGHGGGAGPGCGGFG